MANRVLFFSLTQAQYNALEEASKNASALYFTSDTKRIYKGPDLFTPIPEIDGDDVEVLANKVTSVNSESTDAQYPSAKAVYTLVNNLQIPSIEGLEQTTNKVTSVNSESTDAQYPSAKAVYTAISNTKTKISEATGNAVEEKTDGIYVHDVVWQTVT